MKIRLIKRFLEQSVPLSSHCWSVLCSKALLIWPVICVLLICVYCYYRWACYHRPSHCCSQWDRWATPSLRRGRQSSTLVGEMEEAGQFQGVHLRQLHSLPGHSGLCRELYLYCGVSTGAFRGSSHTGSKTGLHLCSCPVLVFAFNFMNIVGLCNVSRQRLNLISWLCFPIREIPLIFNQY